MPSSLPPGWNWNKKKGKKKEHGAMLHRAGKQQHSRQAQARRQGGRDRQKESDRQKAQAKVKRSAPCQTPKMAHTMKIMILSCSIPLQKVRQRVRGRDKISR